MDFDEVKIIKTTKEIKTKNNRVLTPEKKTIVKKERTNWQFPDNIKLLRKAVCDWDNKEGMCLDSNGEGIKVLRTYCNIVGIPYNTFSKYVSEKQSKKSYWCASWCEAYSKQKGPKVHR